MEHEAVLVVLNGNLRANEIVDLMKSIRGIPGVLAVKTISKVVQEAVPQEQQQESAALEG